MNAWQKACRKRFVRHAFSCPEVESKKRGNIRMLAIFLAPVYILANVITAYWLLRWMKEVHPLFRHPAVLGVILVLYAFFALSLLTSFVIKRDPVHCILMVICFCWLGMYLFFLEFTAILVLLRFIFAHTALTITWLYSPMGLKAVGLGAILFVTGMCIYGMVHAVHIYTTRYEVPSKKDAHLKIALVADLHLGYSIGSHQMEEMVEKINAEEPDVVVIAGDIYDKSVPSAEAVTIFDEFLTELSEITPVIPILIISGNHDSPVRLQYASDYLRLHHIYLVGNVPEQPEEHIEKVTLQDTYGEVDFYLLPFMKPGYVRNVFVDNVPET